MDLQNCYKCGCNVRSVFSMAMDIWTIECPLDGIVMRRPRKLGQEYIEFEWNRRYGTTPSERYILYSGKVGRHAWFENKNGWPVVKAFSFNDVSGQINIRAIGKNSVLNGGLNVDRGVMDDLGLLLAAKDERFVTLLFNAITQDAEGLLNDDGVDEDAVAALVSGLVNKMIELAEEEKRNS